MTDTTVYCGVTGCTGILGRNEEVAPGAFGWHGMPIELKDGSGLVKCPICKSANEVMQDQVQGPIMLVRILE